MSGVPESVLLSRSGGVAGTRPPPDEIDCASLPPAQLRQLVELIKSAAFFTLPCEVPEEEPAPDSFQYTLRVSTGGGESHEVTFSDRSATASLRELKQFVRRIARGVE